MHALYMNRKRRKEKNQLYEWLHVFVSLGRGVEFLKKYWYFWTTPKGTFDWSNLAALDPDQAGRAARTAGPQSNGQPRFQQIRCPSRVDLLYCGRIHQITIQWIWIWIRPIERTDPDPEQPNMTNRTRPNARFTTADPMTRLCPDAVGGESGSTHPMHAWPGPCRAGIPFTLADAPAHCRPIWTRSRVHYDSLSCTQLNNFYIFDSRGTCFVQHLRIQSFTHTPLFCFSLLFFKFMKAADKNTCHQT